MVEILDEHWRRLGGAAEALAAAALHIDDRLLRQSLRGLPGDPIPGIRSLGAIRWRWQLHQTRTVGVAFPGAAHHQDRPIVTVEVRCRLVPMPRDLAPRQPSEGAMPVVVELPGWWRPPTPEALARFAPGKRSRADNTLLMDLSAGFGVDIGGNLGGSVLAVRNPQRLLGWPLHAKLWLDGSRLRRGPEGWPAPPFLAWLAQVASWLADPSAKVTLSMGGDPDDALPQAAAAVAEAHRRFEDTLALALEPAFQLPGLEARRTLADFEAELAVRVDLSGELSGEGEKAALILRSLLETESLSDGERMRWRLLPPDVLASREQLTGLLEALESEHRRAPWRNLDDFRPRLQGARDNPASLAFRTEGSRRWVVVVPASGARGSTLDYALLRADFEPLEKAPEKPPNALQQPPTETPEGPSEIVGGRKVLRWPGEGASAWLDNATVRGLLRLMTALHRFGRAAT